MVYFKEQRGFRVAINLGDGFVGIKSGEDANYISNSFGEVSEVYKLPVGAGMWMGGTRMVVTIELTRLAERFASEKRYLRVKDVSRSLGVSMRTAGKILAAMEKLGLARRWSNGVYWLNVDRRVRALQGT